MPTGLVYDEQMLRHETTAGHPERPDRLRAVIQGLWTKHLWHHLVQIPCKPIDAPLLARIHEPGYLMRLTQACQSGQGYIDSPDCSICSESEAIARLAAGGVVAASDAIMSGRITNAFCAVRPPGHHAEADASMGFCLLNHIALAAENLILNQGLQRVAIVDFDVHHGNGTQHIFEQRADVLVINLHEHPSHLYPGSGFAFEKGKGAGTGTTLNLPMLPGAGDDDYRHAFTQQVIPAVKDFGPQFILVSAGFDAAREDPLAHLQLTPEVYRWMTRQLKVTAEQLCGGRLLSVLEGGYHLRTLSECAALHVGELMHPPQQDGLMAMKAGL